MALGLQTENTGGDFLPIVKYDAKAGRMFARDRSMGADGSWNSDDRDITDQAEFIMDFANITVGWINFSGNQPHFQLVGIHEALPPQPTPDHKQGFRVRIYAPQLLGGTREFSHTAKCVLQVIDRLHDEYEARPSAAQYQLPVVKLNGVTPVKTKSPQGTTTNYAPNFEIVKWVDAPADFQRTGTPAQVEQAKPNGQADPATNVPPPQQAVPAQTQATASEF